LPNQTIPVFQFVFRLAVLVASLVYQQRQGRTSRPVHNTLGLVHCGDCDGLRLVVWQQVKCVQTPRGQQIGIVDRVGSDARAGSVRRQHLSQQCADPQLVHVERMLGNCAQI